MDGPTATNHKNPRTHISLQLIASICSNPYQTVVYETC